MPKFAIIDLDGVVANNDERFARARTNGDGRKGAQGGPIDWSIAFNPALVELDVLIDGADQAVHRLARLGYAVTFLTSRPESMREATVAWLAQHGLDGYELVMKPASAQFTKTVVWKAAEVRRIVLVPDVGHVLFIDDEEGNRAAVQALGLCVACKASLFL